MTSHHKDLYLTQQSLTEWLEDIKHNDAEILRQEDNEKRERLAVLKEISGLPFDEQVKFSAKDIADNTAKHAAYVKEHGDELCALRLIPLDSTLPKLRMRGWSVREVQKWFHKQNIDPEKYRAEYIPHPTKQAWATIFVVNDAGVFGEIIRGAHSQLTQGFYEGDARPYTFSFDFTSWRVVPENEKALGAMKSVVENLHFTEKQQQEAIQRLDANFTKQNYLKGYFETTESDEFGLWFIDYSQKLGELIGESIVLADTAQDAPVKGQIGCAGTATGPVRIVQAGETNKDFPEGAVLVSEMTTPDLVTLMQKASAIVTDNGGILSHAAIVARELKKPCIVGTGNATRELKNGQRVIVDAEKGEVRAV